MLRPCPVLCSAEGCSDARGAAYPSLVTARPGNPGSQLPSLALGGSPVRALFCRAVAPSHSCSATPRSAVPRRPDGCWVCVPGSAVAMPGQQQHGLVVVCRCHAARSVRAPRSWLRDGDGTHRRARGRGDGVSHLAAAGFLWGKKHPETSSVQEAANPGFWRRRNELLQSLRRLLASVSEGDAGAHPTQTRTASGLPGSEQRREMVAVHWADLAAAHC